MCVFVAPIDTMAQFHAAHSVGAGNECAAQIQCVGRAERDSARAAMHKHIKAEGTAEH